METTVQPLNPWTSIWFNPRKTIRYIVDTDVGYRVHLLAMLAGVAQALDRAVSRDYGDSMPWYVVLLLAVMLGALGGLVNLYVGGAILRWVGGKLGGKATFAEVRAAIAWSSLPTIVGMVFPLIAIAFFREEAFTSATPRLNAWVQQSDLNAVLVMMLGLVMVFGGMMMGIWQLVLLSKTLGEVNGFSAWRGLLTFLLPGFVLLLLIFIVFVLPQAIYIGP